MKGERVHQRYSTRPREGEERLTAGRPRGEEAIKERRSMRP